MTIATLIGKLQEDISWLGYNATEREIIEHIKCAITLLKEQEAVKIKVNKLTESGRCGRCPNCTNELNETEYPDYCGFCGKAVKWE